MECRYDWDEMVAVKPLKKKKPKRKHTVFFPTNNIKTARLEKPEDITVFLLKDSQEIGLFDWKIYNRNVTSNIYTNTISYTCKFSSCQA